MATETNEDNPIALILFPPKGDPIIFYDYDDYIQYCDANSPLPRNTYCYNSEDREYAEKAYWDRFTLNPKTKYMDWGRTISIDKVPNRFKLFVVLLGLPL